MSYTTPMAPPNNTLALTGLILGALGAVLAFLTSFLFGQPSPATILFALTVSSLPALLAVIFGFIGISTANRLGGKRRSYAVWSVVLGFTPWVFALLGALLKAAILG